MMDQYGNGYDDGRYIEDYRERNRMKMDKPSHYIGKEPSLNEPQWRCISTEDGVSRKSRRVLQDAEDKRWEQRKREWRLGRWTYIYEAIKALRDMVLEAKNDTKAQKKVLDEVCGRFTERYDTHAAELVTLRKKVERQACQLSDLRANELNTNARLDVLFQLAKKGKK